MDAFYALAVLACPVGMGLMMWFMMRANRQRGGTPAGQNKTTGNAGFSADPREQEVAALRKEVDALRTKLDGQPEASAEERAR
ncbi:hypothetical protein [Streptomyces sp. TRM68367]|uniref:hypothetical protein n=1 Tax=Streptomyces sp. TRM68367 TaxID=2758415 RepID=UPI00165CA3CE|nr:hypothetical protein [Streptomyces sp. TRM68367]MBC9725002.1 hypothetical protein [Streptomyces sp. TRM68367]